MTVPTLTIENLVKTIVITIFVYAMTAPFRHSIDERIEKDDTQ